MGMIRQCIYSSSWHTAGVQDMLICSVLSLEKATAALSCQKEYKETLRCKFSLGEWREKASLTEESACEGDIAEMHILGVLEILNLQQMLAYFMNIIKSGTSVQQSLRLRPQYHKLSH
jgi:hypothetical protein